MSALHKMIANVRSALERNPAAARSHPDNHAAAIPATPLARHAELASQFARELEALKGHFLGVLSPDELKNRAVKLVAELGVRNVAVGEQVAIDLDPVGRALEQSGVHLIRADETDESARTLRDRIANSELAIVEASYAIASTGTFVMVAGPKRPSSLTILPPANLLVVHIDRLKPNLAAALAAIGPETVTNHRVALVTGPSRTADIEKLIVLGVHGPRQLYAAIVWPPEG